VKQYSGCKFVYKFLLSVLEPFNWRTSNSNCKQLELHPESAFNKTANYVTTTLYCSQTSYHKPFDGVREDPFSFAGVPCGDDVSSLPVMPPLPRRLIGLSDGGFGSEGKVGLAGGGPGMASSIMWAHTFSNLTTASQLCHVVHIEITPVGRNPAISRTVSAW